MFHWRESKDARQLQLGASKMQRSEQKLKWTVNCVFMIVREKRTKVWAFFRHFVPEYKILFCYEVFNRLLNWKRCLFQFQPRLSSSVVGVCMIAVNEPVQCSGAALFKSAAKYLKIFPSIWKSIFNKLKKKRVKQSRQLFENISKHFQRGASCIHSQILLLRNTQWGFLNQ